MMSTVNTIDKYMSPVEVDSKNDASGTPEIELEASSKLNRSSDSADSPSVPSPKRTVYDGDEEVFSIPDDAPLWAAILFKSVDNVSKKVSDLASMLDDYKSHVEERLTNYKNETEQKLTVIETALTVANEEKATMSNTITELENKCQYLRDSLHTHDRSIDSLEQYGRRNCVLLHGVKEEKNESTDDVFVDIVSKQLGVKIEKSDIDRSHRIGAPRKDSRHRPIIVKLARYNVRASIFRAKRKFKNTGMLLTDSLTRHRVTVLSEARTKYGKMNVWTMDGEIFTKNQQQTCKYYQRSTPVRSLFKRLQALISRTGIALLYYFPPRYFDIYFCLQSFFLGRAIECVRWGEGLLDIITFSPPLLLSFFGPFEVILLFFVLYSAHPLMEFLPHPLLSGYYSLHIFRVCPSIFIL